MLSRKYLIYNSLLINVINRTLIVFDMARTHKVWLLDYSLIYVSCNVLIYKITVSKIEYGFWNF